MTEGKTTSLTDVILEALGSPDSSILASLDSVIKTHSTEVVQAWREPGKHSHTIIHSLVRKGKGAAVQHLVQTHGFDLNMKRPSDDCTPLHLSAWTKQPELMKLLLDLGANPTLKNKYGEDCAKLVAQVAQMENIVWLDLELTCLPIDGTPSILEMAVVVTDKDLKPLEKRAWVIHHEEKVLEELSDWHQQHFVDEEKGGNGLFKAVLASTTTNQEAEDQLLKLLTDHCSEGLCPLGGQSVHCDREVLLTCMPRIYKYLHHRVIDVSTISGLVERWLPNKNKQTPPSKTYNHRAENDILSSIELLKWYRGNVFQQDNESIKRKRTESEK